MKINYEELKTTNAAPALPPSMIETFRAMGYSLETAMADILDNSISAGANNIWDFENLERWPIHNHY